MGQPTPPGDIPLIDGLDSSWNEFVRYIPEDRRAEFGPKFKERVSSYEALKPWEELSRQGVTLDRVTGSLAINDIIDRDPRQVYDLIGKHLNITPQQAQQVVEDIQEEVEEGDPNDPRIQKLQQQIDTMAQIMMAERQQQQNNSVAASEDAKLNKELKDVMGRKGEVPEQEVVMRMLHMGMTADQAHDDYNRMASEIRKRPPAPYVMGGSGQVPNRAVDPTKLSQEETKNIVAQMFGNANQNG